VGLKHPWVRHQFNIAVSAFGRWTDSKLAERTESGRQKYTLEELLGLPVAPRQDISGALFRNENLPL